VATWTDVAKALRGAAFTKKPLRQWRVKDKLVAWERPLRKRDLEELGDTAPRGPILGVYVPLEVKEALVGTGPYFTTAHFDGYPYVLVELKRMRAGALKKLLASALDSRAARRS
jgi:hypothetical protein